jgi:hypothetical protein
MKKFLILVVAVAVLAPAAAHAFSFIDVINFGERLINRDIQPTPVEVKKEITTQPAQFDTLSAETKFNNWQNAFDKKDITPVLSDSRNLYFTYTELNYLIARELASSTNLVARDIVISLSDNLIKVSGYAMLKSLSGQFYLEAKPATANNRIFLQVTKTRFHDFYFPSFITQALLAGQLKEMIGFLYSSPNYQDLSITVGNGFIELDYGK